MADPGFPIGGANLIRGWGANSQRHYFSLNLYVKTKELGPLDPPLVTIDIVYFADLLGAHKFSSMNHFFYLATHFYLLENATRTENFQLADRRKKLKSKIITNFLT